MLNQATYWVEIAAAVADVMLLLRVVLLKLQRTYLFITLVAVLAVFFDGVTLWLGTQSQESQRVFVYSRFLYAFLYPAAVWDVFEEVHSEVGKLRKTAISRLLSSLLMALLFGLLFTAFADTNEAGGGEALTAMLGIVLWAASSVACVAFLWTLHRAIRAQKIPLPNNTFVWLVFFELLLLAEIAGCIFAIVAPLINANIANGVDVVVNVYGIAITLWCVWRLRGTASGVPSAPEKASL
ncbi:MAG: hypothetical protein JOY54_13885 [Acidobacteriaceae bacterium]|nr:hypothetical protein [Acidobacteriaceae bacterium]